jgi:signal transduction histidine kinase
LAYFKLISTLLLRVEIILFLQLISFSQSLGQVIVSQEIPEKDLTNQFEYFVDSSKKILVKDFLKLPTNKFKRVDFPAFEPNDGTVWATTNLLSNSTQEDYIIYFDQPILGSVEFWLINNGKIETHISYSYTNKDNNSLNRYPHFTLPKFKGERKIVFRIENSFFPINSLIYLAKNSVYENSEKIEGGVLLLCFGISFVIIIYGSIFFFTIREKVYLWFLLYTASMFLISILSFGFARLIFNIDPSVHNFLGTLLSSVALSSLILFVQDILEIKVYAKELLLSNKVAIVLSWIIFVSHNILCLKLLSSICVVYVFFITIYVFIKLKDRSTLFFLISSTFALAGILLWGMVNSGYAPNNFFTHNALILGVTLESVFFSFNLSNRIRKLDEEKNKALIYEKNELSNSNKKLVETQNELENFIYRSHHDYRGPLARISGIVNLMQIDHTNFPVYFDSIKLESIVLSENFDKTLTSWDIEHKHKVVVEQVSIQDEIEKVITSIRKINLSAKSIDLNLPENLTINTDRRCINLSIRYVIENALIFSNPNDRNIKIDYEFLQNKHHFYFRNKGIGVDSKIVSQIFDRHVRGSNKSQGTGLGLYISKQALKKIEATINYVPEDEYTCFKITCPDLELPEALNASKGLGEILKKESASTALEYKIDNKKERKRTSWQNLIPEMVSKVLTE